MAITVEMRTEVSQNYVALFGRAPDSEGLAYWVQQLGAGVSSAEVAQQMFDTEPARAYYPGYYTNEEIVASFYMNVLGREADEEGLAYWAGRLEASTPGAVVREMVDAIVGWEPTGEATDDDAQMSQDLFNNKVVVAEYWGMNVGTIEGSTDVISGVTADSDVSSDESIESIISGSVPGDSFSLTTSADNIAGGSGNDTISAAPVNLLGQGANTLQAFDKIDGGDGVDTMYIYAADGYNMSQGASIQNVEIINIDNSEAVDGYRDWWYSEADNSWFYDWVEGTIFGGEDGIDASEFQGATQIWQIGQTNGYIYDVSSDTTVGFRDVPTRTPSAYDGSGPNYWWNSEDYEVYVDADDTSSAINLAFDNVGDEDSAWQKDFYLYGKKLDTVNISGDLYFKGDADEGEFSYINLDIEAGTKVKSVELNSSVSVDLSVLFDTPSAAGTALVLDASGSTGNIDIHVDGPSEREATTVITGSGDDAVVLHFKTYKDDPTTTTVNETLSAIATTNDGDDYVDVETYGEGATIVSTGDGDDQVYVCTRSTSLTVNLGAGDDDFGSDAAIGSKDVIDGGDGTDALLLSLVGSVNIGAFSNFEVFNAVGLGKTLDIDILASKNTVTEIIASGGVGTASLLNLGAGVGYRVTDDSEGTMSLTQKTAGALAITMDADGEEDDSTNAPAATVTAANATSVNVVFDNDNVAEKGNTATLNVTVAKATSITVNSSGTLVNNILNVTDTTTDSGTSAKSVLATITVTGDQQLALDVTASNTSALSIDASALTGGLIASLADVKNTGSITLGSGADSITVTSASTTGAVESLVNFEKTAAVAVSTASSDTAAKALALADADTLVLSNASVASTATPIGGSISSKGILTFTGAGPTTLAAAIAIADAGAESAGEAVLFQYLNDSYVFVQNDVDTVVKLSGITGVTNFAETGTDLFFIV